MAAFHLGLVSILALIILQVSLNIVASMTTPKDGRRGSAR